VTGRLEERARVCAAGLLSRGQWADFRRCIDFPSRSRCGDSPRSLLLRASAVLKAFWVTAQGR
jgi:hypothetical protein